MLRGPVIVRPDIALVAVPGRAPIGQEREIHVDQLELVSRTDGRILDQIGVRRLQVGMHDLRLRAAPRCPATSTFAQVTCRAQTAGSPRRRPSASADAARAPRRAPAAGRRRSRRTHRPGSSSARPRPPRRHRPGHGEVAGLAAADPGRQLLLIGDEVLVPDHRGRRRLVLLEEDLGAARRQRGIGDRHHPGAEHLGDAVAPDDVAGFELLGHRPLSAPLPRRASSKRDGLGGARNAGGELLQRVAEIDRVGGEFLQRLLRRSGPRIPPPPIPTCRSG